VVCEHLEAGLADVAGRLRVALAVLFEQGEGGGHILAAGAGQAGGVGLVVGQQQGNLTILVLTLRALVRLALQMLLLFIGITKLISKNQIYGTRTVSIKIRITGTQ
jgi:hypothetical protein